MDYYTRQAKAQELIVNFLKEGKKTSKDLEEGVLLNYQLSKKFVTKILIAYLNNGEVKLEGDYWVWVGK